MTLPELRTGRLLLRPWTRADVDALHALWTEPEVRRFLWDDAVIPREKAVETVESHFATLERHGVGYWAIHLLPVPNPAEAAIAGFCGFRPFEDGPEVEILYGLRAQFQGRGFATEAASAALEYLWCATAFGRVWARTGAPNARSVRVMQRLGMRHYATAGQQVTYLMHRPEGAAWEAD